MNYSNIRLSGHNSNIKIALVTGVSSGIGEALSKELILQGYKVIGLGRSVDKLNQMKQDFVENFIPIFSDVSKKEDIQRASNQIVSDKNIPHFLFLNAGLAGEYALEDKDHFDSSIHEKMMDVNYFGVIRFIDIPTSTIFSENTH